MPKKTTPKISPRHGILLVFFRRIKPPIFFQDGGKEHCLPFLLSFPFLLSSIESNWDFGRGREGERVAPQQRRRGSLCAVVFLPAALFFISDGKLGTQNSLRFPNNYCDCYPPYGFRSFVQSAPVAVSSTCLLLPPLKWLPSPSGSAGAVIPLQVRYRFWKNRTIEK